VGHDIPLTLARWRTQQSTDHHQSPLERIFDLRIQISVHPSSQTDPSAMRTYRLCNGVFTRFSKRPANFQQMYYKYTCYCWTFAGRLLDRVNTL